MQKSARSPSRAAPPAAKAVAKKATKKTAKSPPQVTAARAGTAAARGDAVRSWLSVVRAYHLCEAVMTRRLGDLGVKTPEHEILANLRRDPGLTQQVLAQRCFTAKSHISGLLSSLEERGWVRREPDPADARAKRLYLQPAGERVLDGTAAVQADVVATMAAAISPTQQAVVNETMGLLSQALQQMLDDTGAR